MIPPDYHQEFLKLMDDCCDEVPEVGDTVVFASGLIGHGYLWERIEAEVLAVGQSSYKVRFERNGAYGGPWTYWIVPTLVTDVFRASKQCSPSPPTPS